MRGGGPEGADREGTARHFHGILRARWRRRAAMHRLLRRKFDRRPHFAIAGASDSTLRNGISPMRWLLAFALMGWAQLSLIAWAAAPPTCAREDFAQAVDRAGAALRQLNADNAPRLRAKLRELKEVRGWPDGGFEEKAYEILQDERMAALDMQANDLLAKLDTLGTVDPGAEPDCAKLEELRAVGIELQATVKAKTAYTLAKLDQMLGGPAVATEPRPKSVEARPPAPVQPTPKAAARAPDGSWAPKPTPPAQVAMAPPPPASKSTPTSAAPVPSPPGTPTSFEDEGYTIEEIMAASAGFFGKVSANLGAVIEYLFKNSGRPTGYVLGTEGGGAFLAGVRYGSGTLYMRAAGNQTQNIYWHGPSIGTDFGAAGSKTLFLIYRIRSPDQIYTGFTGIDGSAYFVGGVGATLLTNGSLILAPIRSGVGLRLGANIGYIRFTPKATWNPF